MTIKVGQKLWMVPRERYLGAPRFVTVTKVGRTWAHIDCHSYRVGLKSMKIDGGEYTSPGRCYLTKEEHDRELERERVWRELRKLVAEHHTPPEWMTTNDMVELQSLLHSAAGIDAS